MVPQGDHSNIILQVAETAKFGHLLDGTNKDSWLYLYNRIWLLCIWDRWYHLLIGQLINCNIGFYKSAHCCWISKTYVQYCYRNSATVHRLVQSSVLQSTFFCGCPSDLLGNGIQVSPTWYKFDLCNTCLGDLLKSMTERCVQPHLGFQFGFRKNPCLGVYKNFNHGYL